MENKFKTMETVRKEILTEDQKEYLKKEHEFNVAAYKLLKSGGAEFVTENQRKAFDIAQNYDKLTYMLGDIEFRPNDKYLDVLVMDIHLALDVIRDN